MDNNIFKNKNTFKEENRVLNQARQKKLPYEELTLNYEELLEFHKIHHIRCRKYIDQTSNIVDDKNELIIKLKKESIKYKNKIKYLTFSLIGVSILTIITLIF